MLRTAIARLPTFAARIGCFCLVGDNFVGTVARNIELVIMTLRDFFPMANGEEWRAVAYVPLRDSYRVQLLFKGSLLLEKDDSAFYSTTGTSIEAIHPSFTVTSIAPSNRAIVAIHSTKLFRV